MHGCHEVTEPSLRRCRVLSVLIAAVLSVGLPQALAAREFPVSSTQLWDCEMIDVAPVDIGQDSTDEILCVSGEFNYTIVQNQNLQVASVSREFKPGDYDWLRPGGLDGEHLWLVCRRDTTLLLDRLWTGLVSPIVACRTNPKNGICSGAAIQVELHDLEGNGDMEVVVQVQAGFELKPRGICVLDWATGASRWSYRTGPVPNRFLVRDVDHDGRREILFGSAAPGNGSEENGMSDGVCGVFCLTADGELRWLDTIGEFPKQVDIAWLNPQDTADCRLVAVEGGAPLPDARPDSILLLDARTGRVLKCATFGGLYQPGKFTVVRRGQKAPRIAVAGQDDTLRLLDDGLRVVRRVALNGSSAQAICARRFTGAAMEEIAVATTSGRLLLFDADLRPLYSEHLGIGGGMVPLRCGNRYRLLTRRPTGGGNFWQLREFNRVPFWSRTVNIVGVMGGGVLLLLVFLVVFLLYRRREAGDIRAVIRGLSGQAGVVEFDRHGAIRQVNPRAAEILELDPGRARALPGEGPFAALAEVVRATRDDPDDAPTRELPVFAGPGRSWLARCTRVRTGMVMTLEDISAVEYMRRATTWIPIAQRIAHDIKTPLSTIRLLTQQMNCQGNDEARTIQEEIDRLGRMADGFMRLSNLEPPRLQPCDLNQLVQRTVDEISLTLQSGIELKLDLARNLPPVALDEPQFIRVVRSLIDNAVAAMDGTGTLTLATRNEPTAKQVVLEIRDTGPGIPEEYRTRLFQPFFTRKPGGTGLGLSIAKKVIEDHGGHIELLSGRARGTSAVIRLPRPP